MIEKSINQQERWRYKTNVAPFVIGSVHVLASVSVQIGDTKYVSHLIIDVSSCQKRKKVMMSKNSELSCARCKTGLGHILSNQHLSKYAHSLSCRELNEKIDTTLMFVF